MRPASASLRAVRASKVVPVSRTRPFSSSSDTSSSMRPVDAIERGMGAALH